MKKILISCLVLSSVLFVTSCGGDDGDLNDVPAVSQLEEKIACGGTD